MTNLEALLRLHALESWRRIPLAKDGKPYGAAFFAVRDWLAGLESENRRVTLRLSRLGQCIRCGGPLTGDSTGDHIIPLADGGPVGAQNYLPLCRSCNASKGRRDLMEWWAISEKRADELPDDVLCAYARLKYRWLKERDLLDEPATDALAVVVEELTRVLPERHAAAVRRVGPPQPTLL